MTFIPTYFHWKIECMLPCLEIESRRLVFVNFCVLSVLVWVVQKQTLRQSFRCQWITGEIMGK